MSSGNIVLNGSLKPQDIDTPILHTNTIQPSSLTVTGNINIGTSSCTSLNLGNTLSTTYIHNNLQTDNQTIYGTLNANGITTSNINFNGSSILNIGTNGGSFLSPNYIYIGNSNDIVVIRGNLIFNELSQSQGGNNYNSLPNFFSQFR
jgi:hypothetical protein